MYLLNFLLTFCFINGLLSEKIDPSLGEKPGKHASEKILEKEVKEFAEHSSNKIDILSDDFSIEANSSTNDTVIGNLRLGKNYYLKDRNGYYIRWDGRSSTVSGIKRYGLTVDTRNNTVASDWYSFDIGIYNNDLSLKNLKTGHYITNDYTGYFCLMDESGTGHTRGVRLIAKNNGLHVIQSTYSGSPDYLTRTNGVYHGVSYLAAVSSINDSYVAYIDFIPVNHLKAKFFSLSYYIPNDETIQSHSTKLNLISPTYVINNSSSKITHEIENRMTLFESLKWKFDQNIEIFDRVSMSKELPSLVRSNGGFEKIESNFEYKSNDKRSDHLVNKREYLVKKTVEIEPNSFLRIEAFVESVEDLKIAFTAIAEITDNDNAGALTGDQILAIIKDYWNSNLTIIDVYENSVSLQVSGVLFATFGLNNHFIVKNTN
jgi:hypothetical protein